MNRIRRLWLVLAGIALATAVTYACGADEPPAFTHGVASGDVRPDGGVLWTRVDRETTLTVEVATDREFSEVAFEQEVEVDAASDFTVKVDVSGLEPATKYYYRFSRDESVSEAGAFRTAPAREAATPIRFIFSGDSDGTVAEDGTRAFDFRVLDAAQAEEADFFLYFGDTIYADSGFGPKSVTLDDYRGKYKENREIEPLRRILGATSIYTVWDDHEVENDFAGTTVDRELLAAGRQAFREYMPISGDETPEVLYRSFRWGSAVELIVLDERAFRDPDVEDACTAPGADMADILPGLGAQGIAAAFRDLRAAVELPPETDPACLAAINDPSRTLLGERQKAFLFDALKESDATFKFIVNEVPITELVALPYDRWEGYRAERDEVLSFIEEEGITNVVFLTTDFHANIISDVRVRLGGDPVAVEAIAGPIGHTTLADDVAEQAGDELVAAFEGLLATVSEVDCTALDAFSYGLVEVNPGSGTATITLKDEGGAELCQRVLEAG